MNTEFEARRSDFPDFPEGPFVLVAGRHCVDHKPDGFRRDQSQFTPDATGVSVGCALWPYRMTANPWATRRGNISNFSRPTDDF
jgi:hypothetical protein